MNPSAYTAFNKPPVTAPITENPFLTSSAAIDKTDLFTSSVDKSNTAHSLYNGVSLKPLRPDDFANSFWADHGAKEPLTFGFDGNIKQELPETFNSSDVYKKTEEQNRKTEDKILEVNAERQKANAEKWGKLFEMFTQLIQVGAKAFSGSGTA
ncbi:MAG: hypothetical protein KGO93_08660 [Cyanobacteria bacterium REEB446]|nr:hypothetical protein [Cyanobacteria bacterium REEB446]